MLESFSNSAIKKTSDGGVMKMIAFDHFLEKFDEI